MGKIAVTYQVQAAFHTERLRDDGWYVVCRLKKDRTFATGASHAGLPQPYWHGVRALSGGLKLLVVRHHRKYHGLCCRNG